MTTVYSTSISYNTALTATATWATKFRETFLAGGWVQTSDTGQTNAPNLPQPSVINEMVGYEIWRMNDDLQVIAPVFVKIEYGAGPGPSYGYASIYLTIGSGTDGAGTITGVLLARTSAGSGNSNPAAAPPFYGSATPGRISVAWVDPSPFSLIFSIERMCDAVGTPTSLGLNVLIHGGSATLSLKAYKCLRFSNNTLPNSTTLGAWVPSGTTFADSGGIVGVCPVRFFESGPGNPCLSWVAYLNGDIAASVAVPVSMYGVNRTYMPLGTGRISTVASSNANSTLMMLWE